MPRPSLPNFFHHTFFSGLGHISFCNCVVGAVSNFFVSWDLSQQKLPFPPQFIWWWRFTQQQCIARLSKVCSNSVMHLSALQCISQEGGWTFLRSASWTVHQLCTNVQIGETWHSTVQIISPHYNRPRSAQQCTSLQCTRPCSGGFLRSALG